MKTISYPSRAAKSVRSFLTFVALGFLALAFFPATSRAQGTLTNGYTHTDSLSEGNTDTWSFNADIGDEIVVRVGELTDTSGLNPTAELYDPNGVLIAADLNGALVYKSAEVSASATNSGNFTVVVGDVFGRAGNYIVTLAKSPGAISVAPGDEGGAMTNGYTHTGTLPVGDLDVWSFNANVGDGIVVRMGDLTNAFFYPTLRLYGPNGTLIAADLNGSGTGKSAEVAASATNNGTFTVVVGENPGSHAGMYRVTLAKSPGAISVGPRDEGGEMTNGFAHLGTITTGDLDVFSFVSCDGDGVVLQLTELTDDGDFDPTMRLYGPEGTLLNTISGAISAQIALTTPSLGTYMLAVGDDLSHTGTYQLIGLGISTGFILCPPLVNNTNIVVRSAGGQAGSNYVLFTTTNISLPLTNWTPIRTNQFGTYGEFSVTNAYNPGVTPQQYFRARTP